MTRGLVLRGSRNIFTVLPEAPSQTPGAGQEPSGTADRLLECRIKGKILKGVEGFYNPLAPGDIVTVAEDPRRPGAALILAVEERRNRLTRFNRKGFGENRNDASQLLAANVDQIFCVITPAAPPFRPRFLDRALVQAEASGIPAVIVCNKWDLFGGDADTEERLEDFARIGYRVLCVSVKTGAGMDELRALAENRLSVLTGQSGTGKSSIINALLPAANQKTGAINEKYNRGNHTTTLSALFGARTATRLIDTPGIRLLLPDGVAPDALIRYMKEFAPLAGTCSYGHSCSHVSEPGCKILEAVHAGAIHESRYESYLRIREELAGVRQG